MDQYLRLVFPTVYGVGSKDDQKAQKLFQMVISFLKSDTEFFTSKQKQNLLNRLTKASDKSTEGSTQVIFKCEFACSIVLQKQNDDSPIQMHLVAPEQWSSGAHNWKADQFEFCQPKDKKDYYLPQVADHQTKLQTFTSIFKGSLSRALEIIQKQGQPEGNENCVHQHSAKEIHKACKLAVSLSEFSTFYNDFDLKNKKQNENEQKFVKTQVQSIQLNKSNANTCWYVPEATIVDLIRNKSDPKDRPYIDKLIVGFKGYLLQKVTSQRAKQLKYDQNEVSNFKKCLDQLIYRYKIKISIEHPDTSKANRVEEFKKFVEGINTNLKKITKNGLTSKIIDLPEKKGSLPFQLPKVPTMACVQQGDHVPESVVLAQINDYHMKVNERLPFEHLLQIGQSVQQKDLKEQDKWIHLTQRALFYLTENFKNDDRIIDLKIHMRQIECDIGATNLCLLVHKYENIIKKNQEHYGMGMIGQAKSHVELVKTIASIVAFQSVKMNRQRTNSNLDKYRIPLGIDTLYKGFQSHSYEARRAMRNLLTYHNFRKDKKQIFVLDGSSNSFVDFARKVAEQTRSAQVWINNMKEKIQLKKQLLYQNIKLDQANQRLNKAIIIYSNQKNSFNNLESLKSQSYSVERNAVLTEFNEKDCFVHAFLQNVPRDVLGLMKILYLAQNPKQDLVKGSNNLFSNHLLNQEFSINIYSEKPNDEKHSFNSGSVQISSIPVARYFSDVKVLFNNSSLATDLRTQYFENYRKLFYSQQKNDLLNDKLRYFLNRPIDEKCQDREHRLYAKQSIKPEQMESEEFLAIGNIKSAQNTQIMVMCHNILQRKTISNAYAETCRLIQEVLLQTAGQLSLYQPKVEIEFKQIRKLITSFIKVWAFTDVNFCPFIGPFFGYIGRQLIDDNIPTVQEKLNLRKAVFNLCRKCIEEYRRGQKQLQQKPQSKIRWDQRFIVTAAITSLRQIILCPEDQEQIVMLCQLIFKLRSCEIMSGRQQRPEGKRKFEKEFQFSISKTIFNNIEVVSNFLNEKPEEIALIVKKIDQSYPDSIVWSRKNMFSFIGQSQQNKNIYQIDLYEGKIFKNGKQIAALDPKIKENPYFIEIFGKQRQFQVLQTHENLFVRTQLPVNYQFRISQERGLILFEFSNDGKQIRYIYQKKGQSQNDEQKWVLVPRQKLKLSNFSIPRLYIDHYLAWYSQKRKCIMFRSIDFETIYNVGIVLHLELDGTQMKLQKAFHIVYHGSFDDQDLDQLCEKNTKKYDQIILRSKQLSLEKVKCFELLRRFESPEYILQLKNKDTGKIEYLLHRYQIKFFLEDQTRLSSETYFGYSLDHSFYETQSSLFNRFPCLVLRKYSDNPALLNNHKRIVVISDGTIRLNGIIKKPHQPNKLIGSYKFQIHDFFGDIRGSTRQSLFHLSALMLSINDSVKISSIEMTPLDYAIYLLKSCLTNRPYTKNDMEKIKNIINDLNPPESIVLLLECLWSCSQNLISILPFPQQKVRCVFNSMQERLMTCRTLYSNNLAKQLVRHREKIDFNLLKFIGLSLNHNDIGEESGQSSVQVQSSSDSSSSSVSKQEFKYWKKLKKFTGKKFLPKIKEIIDKFQSFRETSKIISSVWDQKNNQANSSKNYLPKQIQKIAQDPEANPMTIELIKDLQSSHDIFLKESEKITKIMTKITQTEDRKQIQTVKILIDEGTKLVEIIQSLIDQIKKKNQSHPDIVTGITPSLSFICFTQIICQKNAIKQYLPHLQEEVEEKLIQTMMIWVQLKTRIASFQRIKIMFESNSIDAISLMREAESPRNVVWKRPYWLCFEAENKVQLWLSQLQTYENLTSPGDFCQLNMGEGKTQVIIPMMILDAIYEKKNYLPRINLLSSLIDEARGNFFRFLSVTGFQIPGFQIPFTRQVDLIKKDFLSMINKEDPNIQNIKKIRNLIGSFSNRLYILMTRQSRLSQVLRYHEEIRSSKNASIKKSTLVPQNLKIYDIFDEIDELMNPLKSYIFSIGETVQLPQSKERFEILRVLIEVFLKKYLKKLMKQNMVISEQTYEETLTYVKKGYYPPGLRLNFDHLDPSLIVSIKRSLAKSVVYHLRNNYFSFFKFLQKKQQNYLIEYIVNPLDEKFSMPSQIQQAWKNQIFVLRGALGYGIFEHCLSMRCGVDYGVPGPQHKKKIAVPYEAADIPSKNSEYQHPDVSILFSYFAYYTKGLTEKQFYEALERLLSLAKTSKQAEYETWFESLSESDQQKLHIKNAQQINYNSKAIKEELYKFYRRNRKTIAFWLRICIFPSNLMQYSQSITASAWDLADVSESVGFSGTKDNHWLYSNKLNWKPCKSPAIQGTDGKMIYLISKSTNKICFIQQNDQSQWQRFVDTALKQKVDCIIDAGALCVGKSLEREIVPWIAKHQNFNHEKYVGISFCDQNGKWKVYKIQEKYYIPRGTSIPDHRTFVIFDEARTRGADLKMNGDAVAAISLGPHMTKDKFMQAAGRLRKLGRNQKLIIMATHQIFSSFSEFELCKDIEGQIKKANREELTNSILAWCCKNSIELNEKLLIQYANLGWEYTRSKQDGQVYVKPISSELSLMYESNLQITTVTKLNEKIVKALGYKYANTPSGSQINKVMNEYGQKVERQASNLDDVCERQVEPQPQPVVQQQDAIVELQAVLEKNQPTWFDSIENLPFTFDSSFKLSQNFINTTKKMEYSSNQNSPQRQLGELYFLLLDQKTLKAISLREASLFIKKHIIQQNEKTYNIVFLSNLSIQDKQIKDNKLELALINAKFLSGVQNYTQEEQQYLLKMFLQSLKKNKQQKRDYEKLTSAVLSKKRVRLKKYFGSTLEKIVTRLRNQDFEGGQAQEQNQDNQLFDDEDSESDLDIDEAEDKNGKQQV